MKGKQIGSIGSISIELADESFGELPSLKVSKDGWHVPIRFKVELDNVICPSCHRLNTKEQIKKSGGVTQDGEVVNVSWRCAYCDTEFGGQFSLEDLQDE